MGGVINPFHIRFTSSSIPSPLPQPLGHHLRMCGGAVLEQDAFAMLVDLHRLHQ